LFGVGIHSTVLAKGAIFGIGVALFGHEEVFLQYGCKYNYDPIEVWIKLNSRCRRKTP
jgi:hypothetical protein